MLTTGQGTDVEKRKLKGILYHRVFSVAWTVAEGDAWPAKMEAYMRILDTATLALLLGSSVAFAFPTEEIPTSEAAYIAKVKTGAPEQIVAKATIVMMKDGKETTLQTGSNGYTCLIDNF